MILMILVVNGEEKKVDSSKFRTLGDLLNDLRKEEQNQVVKRIVVNGVEVPLSRLDEAKEIELREDLVVEITFESLKAFLMETIEEVLNYISKVKALLSSVADVIVKGTPESYKTIHDLAEGLNAIENVRMNTVRITGITSEELGLKVKEEELVSILNEFVEVLQARDLIKVADLVDEKLPTVFGYYEDFFTKARELLRETYS